MWRWALGLSYIVAVAIIWVADSFVVQSVEDSGVSSFLVTYICNSLFIFYIPVVEIARYVEETFWPGNNSRGHLARLDESEEALLLGERSDTAVGMSERAEILFYDPEQSLPSEFDATELEGIVQENTGGELDAKGRWTRMRTAKVSMVICSLWFLAQLSFNLSLKYTTATVSIFLNYNYYYSSRLYIRVFECVLFLFHKVNTIIRTSSSLFTIFLSLFFLGETFTWVKLVSVLLCMGGTIIVSLGDSESGISAIATNPVLGDILALASAGFYAVYITLIRKKIPDEDDNVGNPSMAQFLGFLGLFNLLIFLPVALVLNFTNLEPLHSLSWKQFGLIVGKG